MENIIVEPGPGKVGQTADAAGAKSLDVDSITTTNVSSIFWGIKIILAQGQFQLNFFFETPVIVRSNSQVAVSISEANQNNVPFLGGANMGILNVVPQDDSTITVRGHVDHPARLRCVLNFIIVN